MWLWLVDSSLGQALGRLLAEASPNLSLVGVIFLSLPNQITVVGMLDMGTGSKHVQTT